jgi:hypothetical protein
MNELSNQALRYLQQRQNNLKLRWGITPVTPQALIPYPVWAFQRIELGILDSIKSIATQKTITWNPAETTVNSMTLVVSAESESAYGSTQMVISLNGNPIATQFWDFSGSFSDRILCTPLVYNGANLFEVSYEKNPLINPSATLTITATLELDYTGVQPQPSWWDLFRDWLQQNQELLLVGGGATFIGLLAWRMMK